MSGVVVTQKAMEQMTAAISNIVMEAMRSIPPEPTPAKLTRVEVVKMQDPSVLTDKEAAALFSVNRATWRRWVKQGEAPQPVKFGSCTRWRSKDLRKMIERAQ